MKFETISFFTLGIISLETCFVLPMDYFSRQSIQFLARHERISQRSEYGFNILQGRRIDCKLKDQSR